MNKLILLSTILLLTSCEGEPKTYKVEFKSGKVYRVKSTGYWNDKWIHFYGDQGAFPSDSVKSITVESYE